MPSSCAHSATPVPHGIFPRSAPWQGELGTRTREWVGVWDTSAWLQGKQCSPSLVVGLLLYLATVLLSHGLPGALEVQEHPLGPPLGPQWLPGRGGDAQLSLPGPELHFPEFSETRRHAGKSPDFGVHHSRIHIWLLPIPPRLLFHPPLISG